MAQDTKVKCSLFWDGKLEFPCVLIDSLSDLICFFGPEGIHALTLGRSSNPSPALLELDKITTVYNSMS